MMTLAHISKFCGTLKNPLTVLKSNGKKLKVEQPYFTLITHEVIMQ